MKEEIDYLHWKEREHTKMASSGAFTTLERPNPLFYSGSPTVLRKSLNGSINSGRDKLNSSRASNDNADQVEWNIEDKFNKELVKDLRIAEINNDHEAASFIDDLN